MLVIDVKMAEQYDEVKKKFITSEVRQVVLEHSLVTLSKWEARWEKVFLGTEEKTSEEAISYIEMMVQEDNLPPEVFHNLVKHHVDQINKYIGSEFSATRLPTPDGMRG